MLMRNFCECYSLKCGVVIIGIFCILVSGGLICDYKFQLPGQIDAFNKRNIYPKKNLDVLTLNVEIAIWVLASDILIVLLMMIPASFTGSFTELKTRKKVRVVLIPCICAKILLLLYDIAAVIWLPLVFDIHCWEIIGIMIAIALHGLLCIYLVVIAISYFQELGLVRHSKRSQEALLRDYMRQHQQEDDIKVTGERMGYQREEMTDDEFESIMSKATQQRKVKNLEEERSHEEKMKNNRKYNEKHTGFDDVQPSKFPRKIDYSSRNEQTDYEEKGRKTRDSRKEFENEQPAKPLRNRSDDAETHRSRNREPRHKLSESHSIEIDERDAGRKYHREPPRKHRSESDELKSPARMRYTQQHRDDNRFDDRMADDYDNNIEADYKKPNMTDEEEYTMFTDV